MDDAFAYNMQM